MTHIKGMVVGVERHDTRQTITIAIMQCLFLQIEPRVQGVRLREQNKNL